MPESTAEERAKATASSCQGRSVFKNAIPKNHVMLTVTDLWHAAPLCVDGGDAATERHTYIIPIKCNTCIRIYQPPIFRPYGPLATILVVGSNFRKTNSQE
jgi:hypothetical protein